MPIDNESTILVCLFHHDDQARAALSDLYTAGVPRSSITVIGGENRSGSTALESLGISGRDLKHLEEGIAEGGAVIAVSAAAEHVQTVERIFGEHMASKIDEAGGDDHSRAHAVDAAQIPFAGKAGANRAGVAEDERRNADKRVVPVVEEKLEVGKRTVDQGGVRVYRRVIEIPAEQTVNLRDERVVVERKTVNRPATPAELGARDMEPIELTETAEEAVIGKSARVIEEVVIGKETGERTEHIKDTVRRTEVEVEEIPAGGVQTAPFRTRGR